MKTKKEIEHRIELLRKQRKKLEILRDEQNEQDGSPFGVAINPYAEGIVITDGHIESLKWVLKITKRKKNEHNRNK